MSPERFVKGRSERSKKPKTILSPSSYDLATVLPHAAGHTPLKFAGETTIPWRASHLLEDLDLSERRSSSADSGIRLARCAWSLSMVGTELWWARDSQADSTGLRRRV